MLSPKMDKRETINISVVVLQENTNNLRQVSLDVVSMGYYHIKPS